MPDNFASLTVDDEISLRPVFLVDTEDYFQLVRKNIDHNARWLAWSTPAYSFEGMLQFLQTCREEWDKGKNRSFGILYKSQIVGSIGLYRLDAMTKDPGIGYWLDKDNEGLGIVTRCAAVMVELGFNEFGANLVHITAATENHRSRAVAERLGMTLDGVLRQRTVNAAGEFLDAAHYSVTREEWQARH